jgi:LPXTG-site transpeptidase (sortase) family protein
LWGIILHTPDCENGDEYAYVEYSPDTYDYDVYCEYEQEAELANGNNAPFIAVILILLLVIAGLLGFIFKTQLLGLLSRMKKSKIAVMLLVMLIIAPLAITTTYAAPPFHFGGGNRAEVHINENRNAVTSHDRQFIGEISAANAIYHYGDFLGTLHVERLNRTVRVYAGATMEAMDYGAGHFSFTGLNTGNTGLVGHNRGRRNGFFSFVRLLHEGDIITLTTGDLTRSYAVSMQYTIDEHDFSPLMAFGDNRLTLITCVEYQPSLRRVAVAVEIQ